MMERGYTFMNVVFDIEQAKKCLLSMQRYFSKVCINEKASIPLPQSIVVGSSCHYRYLFYSCLVNYGVRSQKLHKDIICLYNERPCLFSPSYIVENYIGNESLLAEILRREIHVRYPNQCAQNWILLSRTLRDKYHENPQEIFVNGSKYADFKMAIFQLRGFGQKNGGLLLRVLIDEGLLDSTDGIAEIPIDRHDINLSVWLKVISNVSAETIVKSKKIINALSSIWVEAANEMRVSPSIVDVSI